MQPDITTSRALNGVRIFRIVSLFVLLWLPLTDTIFHWDREPPAEEKRALAGLPKYSPKKQPVREYLTGLSDYYADHFGCRNRLIGWNNRWKREWFNESSVPEVLIGKNGWLYFENEDMIDDYRGVKKYTSAELNDFQKLLEARRDWLARRGIKYVFVVAPDKQSIYPEYLPDWLRQSGPHNKLDQFTEHIRVHSTIRIVDFRAILRDAKTTAPTYHNTDSHWNSFGGFLAYREMITIMAQEIPELPAPLPLDAFDMDIETTQGMDLAQMLGQEKTLLEKNMASLSPKPPLTGLEVLADPSIIVKKWPTGREPLYTQNPSGTHSLLMFRDSFAGNLIPYLGYNFKRSVFIFQNWNLPLIEREKPDIVVDEFVERRFNHYDRERFQLPTGR